MQTQARLRREIDHLLAKMRVGGIEYTPRVESELAFTRMVVTSRAISC